MREIKFRAWNVDKNCFFTEDHVKAHLFGYLAKGEYPVMQFTGLKDKNGKEIYEGDVVRFVFDGSLENAGGDDEVGEVVWGATGVDDYYPAFDIKGNDIETNALSTAKNNGDIEVIGNIYENPELIAG